MRNQKQTSCCYTCLYSISYHLFSSLTFFYFISFSTTCISTQHNILDEAEIEHNISEVVRLWTKAAEQNHSWAQVKLGNLYDCGVGVERSLSTAIQYYKKSADQGNGWGQIEYARILISGCGFQKNASFVKNRYKHMKKAVHLLKAAAKQDCPRAVSHLKILRSDMARVAPMQTDPAAFLEEWNGNWCNYRSEVAPLSLLTNSRYNVVDDSGRVDRRSGWEEGRTL